jgi:hypothetical protein
MQLFTMDKTFNRLDVIEEFYSVIWTERFYGDGEFEVIVPLNAELINKLKAGTFLMIEDSTEPMIIETFSIEEGKIKVVGISILSWLNNRFVRTSVNQRRTSWKIANQKPGEILWTIVKQMCTANSTIIGTNHMGLGSAAREKELIIPGLKLGAQDKSGKNVKKTAVPFGPVYDALRKVAEQYKVGMQITLKDSDLTLRFRSYKGTNRTSQQTANPIIRFSPIMDSLATINEIRSIAGFKTVVYSYASNLEKVDSSDTGSLPDTWLQQDNSPGIARRTQVGGYTGFDLRAKLVFVTDITLANDPTDPGPDSIATRKAEVSDILDNRADKELKQNEYVRTVDGEVAPTNLFQYGKDYNLGDIIEVQGNTSLVDVSRVTEYIRTQTAEGEKSYPTVVAIDS